jgi:hypothetical protein
MLQAAQSSQGKAVVGSSLVTVRPQDAAMFLTLVAVANFNIGSGTSTTIEGSIGGLIDQNGRTDGGVLSKPSPRRRN